MLAMFRAGVLLADWSLEKDRDGWQLCAGYSADVVCCRVEAGVALGHATCRVERPAVVFVVGDDDKVVSRVKRVVDDVYLRELVVGVKLDSCVDVHFDCPVVDVCNFTSIGVFCNHVACIVINRCVLIDSSALWLF